MRQEESVILQRKGLNGKSVTGDVRRQKQGASMLGIRWDRPAETAINPPGWGQTGVAGGHFSNNGITTPVDQVRIDYDTSFLRLSPSEICLVLRFVNNF